MGFNGVQTLMADNFEAALQKAAPSASLDALPPELTQGTELQRLPRNFPADSHAVIVTPTRETGPFHGEAVSGHPLVTSSLRVLPGRGESIMLIGSQAELEKLVQGVAAKQDASRAR